MEIKPTQKQGQYLAFIYYYTKVNGCPPAEADIERHFRVTPPAVHQMILTLEKNGFISRVPGQARSIRVLLSRQDLPDLEQNRPAREGQNSGTDVIRKEQIVPKGRRVWTWAPTKPSSVPENIKRDVSAQARALLESELKAKHIKPPPKDANFNYVVDVFTKWHGRYFYFVSKYASPGPNALSPFFEAPFARIEYQCNARFNLAYMRHTGQWWQVYRNLTLDEVLNTIREEPLFQP